MLCVNREITKPAKKVTTAIGDRKVKRELEGNLREFSGA
jgi:hypothetical protein